MKMVEAQIKPNRMLFTCTFLFLKIRSRCKRNVKQIYFDSLFHSFCLRSFVFRFWFVANSNLSILVVCFIYTNSCCFAYVYKLECECERVQQGRSRASVIDENYFVVTEQRVPVILIHSTEEFFFILFV